MACPGSEAPNSAAESLLRGQEEFLAVPRVALGTAAQNNDVPRGALGGLDGAKSILVAALGSSGTLGNPTSKVIMEKALKSRIHGYYSIWFLHRYSASRLRPEVENKWLRQNQKKIAV